MFNNKEDKNNINKFSFIEFEGEEDINFFKKIDYIIDYGEFKDLNFEELVVRRENISKNMDKIVSDLEHMNSEDREKYFEEMDMNYNIYNYKYYCVDNLILLNQNKIDMTLSSVDNKVLSLKK